MKIVDMLKKSLILAFLIQSFSTCAQILILTYHYNRPDLIELQHRLLKKFLTDDFNLIVFNDASDDKLEEEIRKNCDKENIECIRIPQKIHTLEKKPTVKGSIPALRHGDCINYSLQKKGFFHDDIVVILDGDMFLIREFSIRKFLDDKDMAVWIKDRNEQYEYFCPVFCVLNMSRLPEREMLDFSPGIWGDTGAHTHLYLNKYVHTLNIKRIPVIYPDQLYLTSLPEIDDNATKEEKINRYKNLGFTNGEISFLLQKPTNFHIIANNSFFHYCDSSKRHRDDEYHSNKTKIISNYFCQLLKQGI